MTNANLDTVHLDVLPTQTKAAFLKCVELSFLGNEWYLAGGTALALQSGHRQSVDLDFFIQAKTFNTSRMAEQFSEVGDWRTSSVSDGTLYGEFLGAKMSLIAYPSFIPAEAKLQVGMVGILTPPDIAAMKVVAISQRGKKRDFIDLYWLCQNVLPLSECLARAGKQYAVAQNGTHLLKSLVYFADADEDPEPVLFFKTTWKEVQDFFRREVAAVTQHTVGLS